MSQLNQPNMQPQEEEEKIKEPHQPNKKHTEKRKRQEEEDAEEEEEEEEEEDEEEEDDEDNKGSNYVHDGFVIDDDDGGEEPEPHHVHSKGADEIGELTNDDLELIKENTGVKKTKRLIKDSKVKAANLKDLGNALFDHDENEIEEKPQSKEDSHSDSDKDFIVHVPNGDTESSMYNLENLKIASQIFIRDAAEAHKSKEQTTVKKIEHIFEPGELVDQFASEYDIKIKSTDIPERIQLKCGGRTDPNDDEMHSETEWIWERLAASKNYSEEVLKEKISKVLQFYIKEKLEMPFINTYRSHYLEQIITLDDLWAIRAYDLEWIKHIKAKQILKIQVEEMNKTNPNILDDFICAHSIREVEDVMSYIEYENSLRFKQSDYLQYKILDVARLFALKPYDFSKNIKCGKIMQEPPSPNADLNMLFSKYISQKYTSEDAVKMAVAKFIAEELILEPIIKKKIRKYFWDFGTITTTPTDKGKMELDVFHQSYRVKNIIKKPISTFNNDIWIDIINNEKKSLIEVTIEMDSDKKNEIIAQFQKLYGSGLGPWQELRDACIVGLLEMMIPDLIMEIKRDLFDISEKFVINECCSEFSKILMSGPYKKINTFYNNGEESYEVRENAKVMSAILDVDDNNKRFTQCAIVDQTGEILCIDMFETLIAPNNKNQSDNSYRELFERNKAKCKEIIKKHSPDVIVVAANCLEARKLKEDLITISQECMDQDKKEAAWVTFANPSIAKAYSQSWNSTKQHKGLTSLELQAVSLARYTQDPLSETLNLWHTDEPRNAVLMLPLHSHQSDLNKVKLCDELERVAVECVNKVGVDLNRILDHKHLLSVLQFVCGLGPRKVHALIGALRRRVRIKARMELENKDLLDRVVYKNATGFLKIRNDSTSLRELLDETRIHPESYFLASKIAQTALAEKDTQELDAHCVEDIIKNPKKLEELDLASFADQMMKKNKDNTNSKILLDFLKNELCFPFKDIRPPYQTLNNEEFFYLLINETKETFYKGIIVAARVIRINEKNTKCKLSNGLDALLWKQNTNEKIELKPGLIFYARVKEIKFGGKGQEGKVSADFKVDLTNLPDDMANNEKWLTDQGDKLGKYFIKNPDDMINKKHLRQSRLNPKYVQRAIIHKKFKNYSLMQTIEYLKDKEICDFLFRPSSKGTDHITFTMKLFTSVYLHIDVLEEDKPPGASIGEKLKISDTLYNNLDEIILKYRDPIKKIITDSVSHRKFLSSIMSIEQFEEEMMKQRSANPDSITYGFAIVPEYCQTMVLGYIAKKSNFIKEYIRIKPKGLQFHDTYFPDLDQLVSFFKKNFSSFDYQRFVKRNNKALLPALLSDIAQQSYPIPIEKAWASVPTAWKSENPPDPSGVPNPPSDTPFIPGTGYYGDKEDERPKREGRFSSYRSNDNDNEHYQQQKNWGGDAQHNRRDDQDRYKSSTIKCYNCQEEGHISKDCLKKKKACYICHSDAHLAKDCPDAGSQQHRRKRSDRDEYRSGAHNRSRSRSHSNERKYRGNTNRNEPKRTWDDQSKNTWGDINVNANNDIKPNEPSYPVGMVTDSVANTTCQPMVEDKGITLAGNNQW